MKRTLYYLYYLDKKLQLSPAQVYMIGRSREAQIILPHESVSRKHAKIEWGEDGFVLLDLGSTNGTFVNGKKVERWMMYDGDKLKIGDFNLLFRTLEVEDAGEILETLPRSETMKMEQKLGELIREVGDPILADRILGLKSAYEIKTGKLSDMAFRDELTRLFNRRYFDENIELEVARAKRYHRELSLVMADIDHFKRFNDTYGHQMGDEVLRLVAAVLQESCRTSDIVCRYGGEEMVIILPETPLEKAAEMAERIRVKVQEEARQRGGVELTISMGVASYGQQLPTPEELIRAADKALYAAKEGGRNRVEVYQP